MNIQRFTGATAREALGKARMAFGEGTLILSNRPTMNGVEEVVISGEVVEGRAKPLQIYSDRKREESGASA